MVFSLPETYSPKRPSLKVKSFRPSEALGTNFNQAFSELLVLLIRTIPKPFSASSTSLGSEAIGKLRVKTLFASISKYL